MLSIVTNIIIGFVGFDIVNTFIHYQKTHLLFYISSAVLGSYGYLQYNNIPQSYSLNVINYACSYFLFDIYCCIIYKFDSIFLFHGIISFLSYLLVTQQYYLRYSMFFLTYEYSSIFLILMKIIPPHQTILLNINNLFFIITFFVFRILFGTYISIQFIQETTNSIYLCLCYSNKNKTNFIINRINDSECIISLIFISLNINLVTIDNFK